MEEALAHCYKQLGDNVTILFDSYLLNSIKKMVKKQGKKAGGPWDCYKSSNYYGWEAERVVAVTHGGSIMELITRAKIHLIVIIVDGCNYGETRSFFLKAAEVGLVEMVKFAEYQAHL